MISQLIQKAKSTLGIGGGQPGENPLLNTVREWAEPRWADLKNAYIVYHQMVWFDILYYAGQSWISWDDQKKVYDSTVTDDEWTPQPKINLFSPTIDSLSSNFELIPEIEAIPRQMSDMMAHSIASSIINPLINYVITENALKADYKGDENKAGRAGKLFALAGSVFTITLPDEEVIGQKPVQAPTQGYGVTCPTCDKFSQSATPPPEGATCPDCGSALKVQPSTMMVDTGQTEPIIRHSATIEVGNPLHALPRPGATSMADHEYIFWAERMTLNRIWRNWNYEAKADSIYLDGYSTQLDTALQYYYTGSSSQTVRTKENAMVVRVFVQPNQVKELPDGLFAVKIGEDWIHCEVWPFLEHPITKADYNNMPTLFFGRTSAFDLVEIQKESNHYEALIKHHAMIASTEPIVQDENTVVSEITGREDKIIKWQSLGPGSKEPHRLQHGTLDNGVYAQRDRLSLQFENISGAVKVWKGQEPGSITAASAISQLRGQAEQMFSDPVNNWQALWKESVRKAVRILHATMEPWEIAEIVGEDKENEILIFKQMNIDKKFEYVTSSHGLPRTRDERRQEMITLYDAGMLDVTDVSVKQKVFELFGDTGMLSQFNLDATRARMENEAMKTGVTDIQPMVGIEDLATHLMIHQEAIKKLDFDKLPINVKTALMEHTLATKEALMEEQAAQAAMENGPDEGGPDGEGEGGSSDKKKGKGGKPKGNTRPVAASSKDKGSPTGPSGPGSEGVPKT